MLQELNNAVVLNLSAVVFKLEFIPASPGGLDAALIAGFYPARVTDAAGLEEWV